MYFERENKKEEKKQIACPKCGNTDLAFVNVIYSKKKYSWILAIFLFIAIAVFIFLFGLIATGYNFLREMTPSDVNAASTVSMLITLVGLLLQVSSIMISIYAFLKLIPYYNQSQIRYVCKRCGHHDDVDNINDTKKEKWID